MTEDLERRIQELERKKTNQWLTTLLFFFLLSAVLMQLRINTNLSQRIESLQRTGYTSHAK